MYVFLFGRSAVLQFDLNGVHWPVCCVLQRTVADLQPQLVEEDLYELQVEAWQRCQVGQYAAFNRFLVQLLRLDVPQNQVQSWKVAEVDHHFCPPSRDLQQAHWNVLALVVKKEGEVSMHLFLLECLQEGVLQYFVTIFRHDIGKPFVVGFGDVERQLERAQLGNANLPIVFMVC